LDTEGKIKLANASPLLLFLITADSLRPAPTFHLELSTLNFPTSPPPPSPTPETGTNQGQSKPFQPKHHEIAFSLFSLFAPVQFFSVPFFVLFAPFCSNPEKVLPVQPFQRFTLAPAPCLRNVAASSLV